MKFGECMDYMPSYVHVRLLRKLGIRKVQKLSYVELRKARCPIKGSGNNVILWRSKRKWICVTVTGEVGACYSTISYFYFHEHFNMKRSKERSDVIGWGKPLFRKAELVESEMGAMIALTDFYKSCNSNISF